MAAYDKTDLERRMTGAVEALKSDLVGLRTGRASTSLLDPVTVEVYGADPKVVPTATRYETVSYDTVLAKNLRVMDASAIALCRDNNIPIVVFNIREHGNFAAVLGGEGVSTTVQNEQ